MSECRDFGSALRRERERRGISLEAVADRTKIGLALLAGLERGDLTRWPSGIFRRAFIRAYADAIGLAPDDVVVRFERVFAERPDPVAFDGQAYQRPAFSTDPLRLTLASTPRHSTRVWATRLSAAIADVTVVGGAGAALAWAFQQPVALAALAAGSAYFVLGTLLLESSPATWAARRLFRPRPVAPPAAQDALTTFAVTSEPEPRRPDTSVVRSGRDRRQGRPERRRVARPAQRPQ